MADETPPKKPRSKKRSDRKSYIIPDANLAQQSRVFQKMFTLNIPGFNAIDTDLTPAYANAWMATIEAFEIHPTDETMMDEIQIRMEKIEEYIKQAMVFVEDIEYYTTKAFKAKPRIIYEFGFDHIKKEASGTNPRFIIHCLAMLAIAEDYLAELTAAGMPPNLLTDFDTFLGTAGSKYVSLEVSKRERIRATTKRVDLYNELNEYWAKVKRAAALVYRNDEEALKMWVRG